MTSRYDLQEHASTGPRNMPVRVPGTCQYGYLDQGYAWVGPWQYQWVTSWVYPGVLPHYPGYTPPPCYSGLSVDTALLNANGFLSKLCLVDHRFTMRLRNGY